MADSTASSPGIKVECTPRSALAILKCPPEDRQPSPHPSIPLSPPRIASSQPPLLRPPISYDPPRLLPPTDRLKTLQIKKGKTVITTLAPLPLPLQPPKPTQPTHHNPVRPQTTEVTQMDCPGPSRLPDPNPAARFKTRSARPALDPTDQTMRSHLTPQAIKFDLLHNQQSDQFPGLISPIEAPAPIIVPAGQMLWQQPMIQITAPRKPLLPLPYQPHINIGETRPFVTTVPMISENCIA